ncbi:hypothetical protein PHYPSEUDO_000654 [Phytophthora pseudosyringae]|uniref:Acyltransferase 3 domain-containing protein n=1 Tax=Phytophthora pseudosyringae TaxID=221518 RepID=A0A8T1V2P6_9STRA|nr:hypothetical protein PHYPSEUDO_000654 [Phytophthora pseudosyringae]
MLRAGRGEYASIKGDADEGGAVTLNALEPIVDLRLQGDTEVSVEKNKKSLGVVGSGAPPKVLFLDGIRGLAAMLVVLQHSNEYMNDINVGASAVDAFFVLSSFLLTMLFLKKAERLLAQGASYRKWAFTLADYFLKRFFRVYPCFALLAVLLWLLPFEYQNRFFLVETADKYDLYKVLTFDIEHRYLMLWTLPLEIVYYFFIPTFVLATARMRRFWWVAFTPLHIWVLYDGFYTYRSHHTLLRPHFTTFLQGSMAAVIFVKIDTWRRDTGFEFSKWQVVAIRATEYATITLLVSECFRALLYEWVHENFVPIPPGDSFISMLLASIIVIEMVLPSSVSTTLEWNVLRHWGKISFSVYLLHPFVIFSETIRQKNNYYDRYFGRLLLLHLVATMSYYVVEYPLQMVVRRLSWQLAQVEKKGGGALVYSTVNAATEPRRSSIADCV